MKSTVKSKRRSFTRGPALFLYADFVRWHAQPRHFASPLITTGFPWIGCIYAVSVTHFNMRFASRVAGFGHDVRRF